MIPFFIKKLKIKTPKMGIQGNNPQIFLWHLYDQKFLKKFFFDPANHEFGARKKHTQKMSLKSQGKTKPLFP